MADQQGGSLVPLRKLLETHTANESTDGQLLTRFAAQRDESAFAALMKRHGPLVYGVCRHVLGHEHDAEDAFQGTFLVLARNAASIQRQNSVAGWLHGVAYRLSLKARQTAARRRRRESLAAKPDVARTPAPEGWRELQAILDEELGRLPEKLRTPFVLCVLENKSKPEAARQLRWPEGTVSSRLARARELLKSRLSRRGVELSALLCGLAVAEAAARAELPPTLISNTLRASTAFGARHALDSATSAHAVALAEGWLRAATLARLKQGLSVLALVLAAGSSAAALLRGSRPTDPPTPAPPRPPADAPQVAAIDPNGDGLPRMMVSGRVVGGDGQGVPNADVAILAEQDRPPGDRDFNVHMRRKVVTAGRADRDGRFRISAPRPVVGKDYNFYCLARGDGQAVAWQPLQTVVDGPELVLKLEAAQQVKGWLVDAAGAPAAGVQLRVGGFRRLPDIMPIFADEVVTAAWPAPATTDAEGRFLLNGVLSRATVHLE